MNIIQPKLNKDGRPRKPKTLKIIPNELRKEKLGTVYVSKLTKSLLDQARRSGFSQVQCLQTLIDQAIASNQLNSREWEHKLIVGGKVVATVVNDQPKPPAFQWMKPKKPKCLQ
jgi:hypothetical protein